MKKILVVVLCSLATCFAVDAQEDAYFEAALDEAVALCSHKLGRGYEAIDQGSRVYAENK